MDENEDLSTMLPTLFFYCQRDLFTWKNRYSQYIFYSKAYLGSAPLGYTFDQLSYFDVIFWDYSLICFSLKKK